MVTTRHALWACCLALVALCPTAEASAAAPAPILLNVSFGEKARLGASTSVSLNLHVDSSLAPVTEFRLLTPPSVEIASSQLGAAICPWPKSDILQVMGPVTTRVCPANSLLGSGSVTAGLRLNVDRTVFGAATLELHSGASVDGKPGLLVTVNTYNPIRAQLVYAGYLYAAPGAFGLGLAIKVPLIPRPPFGAPIALSDLHMAIGSDTITYERSANGHRAFYRPGGLPLPASCPRGGFRFRTILRFADGSRRQADAVVPCPPRSS
jgi:hypothetical protein